MKCPKCQADNPDNKKFCRDCGARLSKVCPQCGSEGLPSDRFCGECGKEFEEREEKGAPGTEAERKHVTVLFSDLSGYTAMSERLDPEELKEIMNRIFGEIAQVVTKYEGFVEKFVGDAVMALFGVPKAHEDDPIRAIRAAREIHNVVRSLSPEIDDRIGASLWMHSGINTGLVVTGEIDLQKGTHGVSGDTLNLASRLSGHAKAGEIVVGPETYRQAEGSFTFESLGPTAVKGKTKPVKIYKVLSPKEEPRRIHRIQGVRADLIGRKAEMAQLAEAIQRLRKGERTILSICGGAGTGKSRLVEEFKTTLNLRDVQWREGHAYAYSQNIPYFPLIDLLNRTWHIEEGDPPEEVRNKVESGIEGLIDRPEDAAPYVGRLYSLSYPEIERVSPEFWKSRLQEAIRAILAALTQVPTVICLEDIHWADPSSLELFRHLMSAFRQPAVFLCVYRPPFSLFTSHELGGVGRSYQEIRLQDLSPSETQDMMESLLGTKAIPPELGRFIQEKVEGNPFYLEEAVNALIESGTLVGENGTWRITRSIGESDIPSTIQGVISARLDRLEREAKRILQEASVIGRSFLYEILRRITELQEHVDRSLSALERLDLIRTRSLQPDLEYTFKHALTQDVAYGGLLKRERQQIHERIGFVMEQLFQDRLPEFSETLAFHFSRGLLVHKAVDYLMKSGEKSLGRYAVEEAHQYYREAFDLLSNKPDRSREDEELLIDLLVKWAYVFYYRGDFRGLTDLLKSHEGLAEALNDKTRLGMFYGWLGMALWPRERFRDSYHYLCKALKIGEAIGDQKVVGYACTWLTWTCADLGFLQEAIRFGERAQEIYRLFQWDDYLYLKSLGGIGYVYWLGGERRKTYEAGKALVEFGQRLSNTRSMVMGHHTISMSHFMSGDFPSAIESSMRAIQASSEPYYTQIPRTLLGMSYLQHGQLSEAEGMLQEVLSFSEKFGAEAIGTPARMGLAVLSMAKGNMSQGLWVLEEIQRTYLENGSRFRYALSEYFLGKVYYEIVRGAGPGGLFAAAMNLGFLLKEAPFASRKAEAHFNGLIEVASEIGDRGFVGEGYFGLGLLHKEKKRIHKARECISEAIKMFEECGIEVYLKQAKEALEDLG